MTQAPNLGTESAIRCVDTFFLVNVRRTGVLVQELQGKQVMRLLSADLWTQYQLDCRLAVLLDLNGRIQKTAFGKQDITSTCTLRAPRCIQPSNRARCGRLDEVVDAP